MLTVVVLSASDGRTVGRAASVSGEVPVSANTGVSGTIVQVLASILLSRVNSKYLRTYAFTGVSGGTPSHSLLVQFLVVKKHLFEIILTLAGAGLKFADIAMVRVEHDQDL